jgi:hypothetical protein
MEKDKTHMLVRDPFSIIWVVGDPVDLLSSFSALEYHSGMLISRPGTLCN